MPTVPRVWRIAIVCGFWGFCVTPPGISVLDQPFLFFASAIMAGFLTAWAANGPNN